METLEIDSSQSALLVRGAKVASKCTVKDLGPKVTSSVSSPRPCPVGGALERLRTDHVMEKKTAGIGSIEIIMNRVLKEGIRF